MAEWVRVNDTLLVSFLIKTRTGIGGLSNYGSCFVFRPAMRCLFQWCRGTTMLWSHPLCISGAATAIKHLRHTMN